MRLQPSNSLAKQVILLLIIQKCISVINNAMFTSVKLSGYSTDTRIKTEILMWSWFGLLFLFFFFFLNVLTNQSQGMLILFLQLTSEMFEADLEKALLLSKLEYEEHKKVFLGFILM